MAHISDPIERLLAYEEIRQLAAHYAVALDSRDLDALVELFVDDVRVGKDITGRDALRAAFADSLAEVGVTILNVGTHAIDLIDDDHATGVVYCKGEIEEPPGSGAWIHQAILYRDTYERRDGSWHFVRRVHELWYGQQVPSPLDQPPADWPERSWGRGTVPESWETWSRFWVDRT